MYREVLLCLSKQDLENNISRLTIACDELRDCIESLAEENDELQSINETLKSLKSEHQKLLSSGEFKTSCKVQSNSSSSLSCFSNNQPVLEESKQEIWTEIVQEAIDLPKPLSKIRQEKPVVPKIKIPRPRFKK